MPTPRIPPLPEEERDDESRELLAKISPRIGPAANIFATLVRHPDLYRKWLRFGTALLFGTLPARDRELLIMRSAWLCRSDYEWGQHVRIAREAGVSDEEMVRIVGGPEAEGWDSSDAVLLRAADELHDQACITDGTWAALAERYDERQLIELPLLVGHYHMLAYALNSLGVPREPGVVGLPAEDG